MTHILIPQVEDLDPVVFARRRLHAVEEAVQDLPVRWVSPSGPGTWAIGRIVAAVVIVAAIVLAIMVAVDAGESSPAPVLPEVDVAVAALDA